MSNEVDMKLTLLSKTYVLREPLEQLVRFAMKQTFRTADENTALYMMADALDHAVNGNLADEVNATWYTRPCAGPCNYPYDGHNEIEVTDPYADVEYCSQQCEETPYYSK